MKEMRGCGAGEQTDHWARFQGCHFARSCVHSIPFSHLHPANPPLKIEAATTRQPCADDPEPEQKGESHPIGFAGKFG
jgi:hypothetical protein